MALHTPYSPGDPIKSANTNDDIIGLSDGTNDADNNSLYRFRLESLDPYFAGTGVVWTQTTGRTASMTSGVLYVAGNRVPINAISSKTFTASKDTYVDFSNVGVAKYAETTNGGAAPALDAGYTRQAIVITDASNITSIVQRDRDTLGNLVCNRKPVARESSAPRVSLVTTASSITPDTTNHDVIAVTALAGSLTINAPAGTPANAQGLLFRFKDNGSARSLTWNGIYRAIGVTIPNATVASKTYYVFCRYNSQDNKWDVLGVGREG